MNQLCCEDHLKNGNVVLVLRSGSTFRNDFQIATQVVLLHLRVCCALYTQLQVYHAIYVNINDVTLLTAENSSYTCKFRTKLIS